MSRPLDPARLKAASARFVAFFRELSGSFLERDDVLHQIALALLSREHVLLTGPPGTAKSQLASAVFERLIDEETGEPSLYARQFTESTVQTDLVGPINFKTLTETGRTEHFTDEGMLGAVHAFLDEVFDGRDMLLRAALNVLHERELKQGTRITRGRFECALLASNRYLADILESSRETLLAFVDRIAFVSFIPRGFADPRNLGAVLKRQIGGASRRPLEEPLTIQDVDALQAMVDSVYISDAICGGLATLLELLDAELQAAVRADPTFIPTRYLSTRTAVRSGRILRAICVYDKLFRAAERPLEVLPRDLEGLRLHLVLTGPEPGAIAKLLERETEARERRQLGILRTEREIFDRCWAKMPHIRIERRPDPEPPPVREIAPKSSTGGAKGASAPEAKAAAEGASNAPKQPERRAPSALERRAAEALATRDPRKIAPVLRDLVPVSHGGGADGERATALMRECVAAIHAEALGAALAAGAATAPVLDAATGLAELADVLDEASAATRPLSRWLRGRALALIGDAAAYALGVSEKDLEIAADQGGKASLLVRAERRLKVLEQLAATRASLVAQGVDAAERDAAEGAWARGIDAAEEEAVIHCDGGIQEAAAASLATRGPGQLAAVLRDLAGEIERVERVGQRIAALRGAPPARAEAAPARASLEARVLGPRVGALVAASFDRLDTRDRDAFFAEIERILDLLASAGLAGVVAPRDWIGWTAGALVRAEREAPAHADAPPDLDGYRALRGSHPRVSNAYVIAKVAVRVAAPAASPAEGLSALAALLAVIPEPTRAEAVRLDLARVERAVAYLERWWEHLARDGSDKGQARLGAIAGSQFFALLFKESALVRFVLETRVIGELFPDHAGAAAALRARIDALQDRARHNALELLRGRNDAAWAATLREPAGRAP